MDSLKLIPQIFFDIICRVIPGALGIVAALLLSGTNWESWMQAALGRALASQSPVASVIVFAGAAYVVGQILSPLAKWIQRAGESCLFKQTPKATGFDWLRMHHPESGAFCAKIRAEFLMHNAIASVLLISAAVYPFRGVPWRWPVLVALLVIGLVAADRGRQTRNTFNETVTKFADAAGYKRNRQVPLLKPEHRSFILGRGDGGGTST